mgnify:CR=1 FL=1|jgi:hypothetical protein
MKEKTNKIIGWAIVVTIKRPDGTWYTDTITEIDNSTSSSVDSFLTEVEREKNGRKN